MKVSFQGYELTPLARALPGGRFGVGVEIHRAVDGLERRGTFLEDDRFALILQEEAVKEGLTLGRKLILGNRVGF